MFISVKDDDKPAVVDLARRLRALGFTLVATGGTHQYLKNKGIATEQVLEGDRGPAATSWTRSSTARSSWSSTRTFGKQEIADSFSIRREALMHGVPYYTTVQAARMAVGALEALARGSHPGDGAPGCARLEALSVAG